MNQEPIRAAEMVIRACDRLGIPYYVAGSLASSRYGYPRSTNDVDVILDLHPDQVDHFVSALGDGYYADAAMIRNSLRMGICSNLIHLETMIKIDLYDLKSMPFSQEAMQRRQVQRTDESQVPIAFATAEDVLLAKMLWYRQGGDRSDLQKRDLIGILRIQGETLDVGYIEAWVSRLELGDLWARLRQDV